MLAAVHFPVHADTLYIGKVAAYRDASKVRQAVREECRMDTQLPGMIRHAIGKLSLFPEINLIDEPLADNHKYALIVTIVSLDAPPGGGWSSSPKFMKIKAVLYRNGTATEEFVQSARAGHGATMYKHFLSNCQIVDRLADQLSEQVASWLKRTGQHVSINN
jgi:hypothetical protein